MKLRRSHGLTVFFSLKKYFWVLVLPVIRAVLLYGADVENAFAGYGADIALASLILFYSVIKQRFSLMGVKDGVIEYRSGLLIKRTLLLDSSQISCIKLVQTPFTALFSCHKAVIYTVVSPRPTIIFYADARTAARLAANKGKTVLKASYKQNLFHSVLNADGANGLLKVSAALSVIGTVLGKGVREVMSEHADLLPEHLSDVPKLTVIAAAVLFFGWLVSVAVTLLDNADFSVKKSENAVIIRRGVFIRQRCIVTDDPSFLVFSQNFLCGGVSVFAFANGFSPDKERCPLIPYAGRLSADAAANALCGVFTQGSPAVSARAEPLRPFVLMPACLFALAVFSSAAGLAAGLFGGFNFAALLLPLPFLWQMICGFWERKYSGISESAAVMSAVYRYRSKRRTAVFPKERCGMLTVTQNIFQRRKNRCDLRLFLPAGEKEKIRLRQLSAASLKKSGVFSFPKQEKIYAKHKNTCRQRDKNMLK